MTLVGRLSRGSILKVIGVAVIALAPTTLFATAVSYTGTGDLNTSNTPGTEFSIYTNCIDFGYPGGCQATTGIQDSIGGASDTSLFSLAPSPSDTVKDILIPVTSMDQVDFESVVGPQGTVFFDLETLVMPTAGGNCSTFALNAVCHPAGSPLVLTQSSANTVSISFSTFEIAYLGTSPSGSTEYTGIFSTQLAGDFPNTATPYTIPGILNDFAAGLDLPATWSSTQTPVTAPSAVPEPGTFAYLLGPGLAGLALLRRRLSQS